MHSLFSNLLYGVYVLFCCPCEVISIRNQRRRRREVIERRRANLPEVREARRKARDANPPVPLPVTRPRALTLPLPEMQENAVVAQVTKHQGQSVLFRKLPLEIRTMIYVHVFTTRSSWVHIVRKPDTRLANFRCKGFCKRVDGSPCWGKRSSYGDWEHEKEGERTDGGNLPLLRTCRKIYSEAVDVLYAANQFEIDSINNFYWLSVTVLPQRMDTIRNLYMSHVFDYMYAKPRFPDEGEVHPPDSDWTRTCDILGEMKGLQVLGFFLIVARGRVVNLEQETMMLAPLTSIKPPKDFIVDVGWAVDEQDFSPVDRPFHLSRSMKYGQSFPSPFYRSRSVMDGSLWQTRVDSLRLDLSFSHGLR